MSLDAGILANNVSTYWVRREGVRMSQKDIWI